MRLLEALGVELPVVQAGMGGGVAGHELAAAVSEAGGLGTVGMASPKRLRAEVAAARSLTGRPVAVNVLLPFARRGHREAVCEADLVVTFWGRPRRLASCPWLHQCGSVAEALAAYAKGADGVVAQGCEAGGHVRGTVPATELLQQVRDALPDGYPVLSAGAMATPADVRARLEAGAEAAVLGTRFLVTEESRAHPRYKERACEEDDTVLTELFGAAWPAPHRVLRNAATERWLRRGPRAPAGVRALHRATAPLLARAPEALLRRAVEVQSLSSPLLAPQPPIEGGPESLLETGPLYAGESVAGIGEIRPAGALTRWLAAA